MKECFECKATQDLQEHHVVPKSRGGTKTVTLCYSCHMMSHGRDSKGLDHKRLTKEGLSQAKLRGAKLGSDNPAIRAGLEQRSLDTLSLLAKPLKDGIQQCGYGKWTAIARWMMENEFKTPNGKDRWYPTTVRQLVLKMKEVEKK